MAERPIDALDRAKGKKVYAKLKKQINFVALTKSMVTLVRGKTSRLPQ